MAYNIQDVAEHIYSEYESFLVTIEDDFTLSSICDAREKLYSIISRNERYVLVELFRTQYFDDMERSFYTLYKKLSQSFDMDRMVDMYVDPRVTGNPCTYEYTTERILITGLLLLMSPYVILSPGSESKYIDDHTYMKMYREVQRFWIKNVYHVPRAWSKNIGISIYLSDNYYDVLYQHLVDIGNQIKNLDTVYFKVYYVDMPCYDNILRGLDLVTVNRMTSLLMDIVYIYIGSRNTQPHLASRIHKMQLHRLKTNDYTFLRELRSREFYDSYTPYWKRPTSEFFITGNAKLHDYSYDNIQRVIETLFFERDKSNVMRKLITVGWTTLKGIVTKTQ